MTLPPTTDSFFDGGEPQSVLAPGDPSRELMHDIRNLTQAVSLLGGVVKKQRQRQKQIIVTALVSLFVLVMAIGYSRYLYVEQTQERLRVNHAVCDRSNARGDALVELLTAANRLSNDPRAKAFYEPRIKRINALREDCNARYPSVHAKGWPSFWHSAAGG